MRRNISRYPRRDWIANDIIAGAGRRYFRLPGTASGPSGGGAGFASFDIVEINAPPLNVAPYSSFWRAANIQGFENPDGSPLVEGNLNANVFDPAQRHITWLWDMGADPYTFVRAPNTPADWRDWNKHYGKQVAHTFDTHGAKTVLCGGYDTRGNIGFATFNRTVNDPDVVIPANRTIYFSQAGTFPIPLPAGSYTATTDGQVRSAQLAMGATGPVRIRLPFGEVFTTVDQINRGGEQLGLVIDCWGNPASGRAEIFNPGTNGPFEFTGTTGLGVYVSNIIIRGSYVPARDIGFAGSPYRGENSRNVPWLMHHRCKFAGWANSTSGPRIADLSGVRIYSDTEITDFQNYGIGGDALPNWWALIGCDLHQNPDIPNGNFNVNGDQQNAGVVMGPQHGPLRADGFQTYIGMTSFFSCTGWFGASDATTLQPSHTQGCVRFWHNFDDAAASAAKQGIMHHHVWERCTFEGGDAPVALANSARPASERPRNFLMDRFIVVGTAASYDYLIGANQCGITLRNGLILQTNVQRSVPNETSGAFNFSYGNDATLPRNEVYNVTYINLLATSQIRTPFDQFLFTNGPGSVQENNILLTPSRSLGEAVSNLSTTPISGFALRYKGARWNFPPMGGPTYSQQVPGSVFIDGRWAIPASARRENPAVPGTIQTGPVADNEWMIFPYPDYTGFCRGANPSGPLGQVTRAIVLANSTQYHQVSFGSSTGNLINKRMAPAGAGFGADGRVAFDFPLGQTYFRVQNRSGTTVPEGAYIRVALDLSDSLMGFVAGTAHPTTTVPQYRPLASSAAFRTGGTGLRAFDDALRARRPGSLTDAGAVIAGTASRGWVEPA